MPEGHTIHRLARDHARWFRGGPLAVSSPQLTFPGARLLDGQELIRAEAHGKHLFHHYEGGEIAHVHLGLFGKFLVREVPSPEPLPTVKYRIVNAMHCVDLVGATACELLTPDERDGILDRLGPDPIKRGADPELGWDALQRRSISVGRSLMDQKVLAGVGNVYRAEVLFVHGIHPDVASRDITHDQWQSMWDTLVSWMRRGVREQRIITVDRAEIGRPRGHIATEDGRYVYKREHCLRCGTAIRRWDLAGRWAYACETCQPPPAAA